MRWHGDLWQLEDAASLNGTFHRGARVDRLAVRGPTSVRLGHPDQGLSMELEPVPAPEDHAAHPATQGLEVRSASSAEALWDMPWERLVDQVAQSSPEAVLQARVAMEVAASQQRLIWALWILAGAAVVLAAVVAIARMKPVATFFGDLGAEVDVPDGGTLSRVLYKDDRVRVVIFAFDTGQELTEHTAAVPALIQVLSGYLELDLGAETTFAAPGSWTHLPAHLPHSVRALEPSIMLLTMLPSG